MQQPLYKMTSNYKFYETMKKLACILAVVAAICLIHGAFEQTSRMLPKNLNAEACDPGSTDPTVDQ